VNDTFSVGDNVFVLFNDRTAVAECRVIGIPGRGQGYIVEVHHDNDAIRGEYIRIASDVFRSKAKAWYAVAQKWAAIRDVAEANRARAIDLSIA
jgi:hypothetical protein